MGERTPDLAEAHQDVLAAIERLKPTDQMPIVVALDGKSGSGKSTLAKLIAEDVHAAIIQMDDFFAAEITDKEWDSKSVEERATDCFHWQLVRSDALEPLISGRTARWLPFDFDAKRPDGTYGMKSTYVEMGPAPVILLDGIFSTGPQLVDLVNLTVLLEVPDTERNIRRIGRGEDHIFLQRWHDLWDAVVEDYFTSIRPRGSFDLAFTTMSEP